MARTKIAALGKTFALYNARSKVNKIQFLFGTKSLFNDFSTEEEEKNTKTSDNNLITREKTKSNKNKEEDKRMLVSTCVYARARLAEHLAK